MNNKFWGIRNQLQIIVGNKCYIFTIITKKKVVGVFNIINELFHFYNQNICN